MNTIKYLQVFLIIVLIISICCLEISYIGNIYKQEGFLEYENVDIGSGLPLSVLSTITFKNNTSYSEIGENEIKQLTRRMVDMFFWGTIKEPVSELVLNDEDLLHTLSEHILAKINKQLDASEQPFMVMNQSINSKHMTSSQEYIISSTHLIYREGKMYGFILNIISLWTVPRLELKGFTEVTPFGILMEDDILLISNDNNNKNYREYGDSASFIQSEVITKDKEYENNVSQKQIYGLLQDRGISATSFAQS